MTPLLSQNLAQAQQIVRETLQKILPQNQSQLAKAMRHATLSGGKRLRPLLLIQSAKLFQTPTPKTTHAATALECIHAYSLTHDDLPSMDNGITRHGKPTTHIIFGESIAILAGDALLTLAFQILAQPHTSPNPQIRAKLAETLARAAGAQGMAGGQALDLSNPAKPQTLYKMREMKTAKLFAASCEMGAILANAPHHKRQKLKNFGTHFGIAFQIADDLRESQNTEKSKKSQRKTYAASLSPQETKNARAELRQESQKAIASLAIFREKADCLREATTLFAGQKSDGGAEKNNP